MIKPSEAYTDKKSLKTVINKKRDIAVIIPAYVFKNEKLLYKKLKYHNLCYLTTNNPYGSIIIYRKSSYKNAKKLQNIIKKGNGFLIRKYWKQTGKLLGYL